MYRGKDGRMYQDKDDEWWCQQWEKWNNEERLAWMRNFRDKLKAKYVKTLNVSQEELDRLDEDVAEMEKIVEQEKQARLQSIKMQAELEMNRLGDEILGIMDNKKKRSLYIPPKLPIKNKSN